MAANLRVFWLGKRFLPYTRTKVHFSTQKEMTMVSEETKKIQLKKKIFLEIGLSAEETTKLFSACPSILDSSIENRILPAITILKDLLLKNENVARLLRKCGWPVVCDLKTTLVPNIKMLENCGVQRDHIFLFFYSQPRLLLINENKMKKAIDKAREVGVSPTSKMFIRAACYFATAKEEDWQQRLKVLGEFGFKESDVLAMFPKAPLVFLTRTDKMKRTLKLILGMGYNISDVVVYPRLFDYSIEGRLEPRVKALQLLDRKGLNYKLPGLPTFCMLQNDEFVARYLNHYEKDISKDFYTYLTRQSVKQNCQELENKVIRSRKVIVNPPSMVSSDMSLSVKGKGTADHTPCQGLNETSGKSKLKYELQSYPKLDVKQMKQMSEDNQHLTKNKVVKKQRSEKALEESFGIVTEKLQETMVENQVVKLKATKHHEQNKEELYNVRKVKEENLEKIPSKENVSKRSMRNFGSSY